MFEVCLDVVVTEEVSVVIIEVNVVAVVVSIEIVVAAVVVASEVITDVKVIVEVTAVLAVAVTSGFAVVKPVVFGISNVWVVTKEVIP